MYTSYECAHHIDVHIRIIEIIWYRVDLLRGIAFVRKMKRAFDGYQSIEYDYDC